MEYELLSALVLCHYDAAAEVAHFWLVVTERENFGASVLHFSGLFGLYVEDASGK